MARVKRVNRQSVFDRSGREVIEGAWDPRVIAAYFRDEDLRGKRVIDIGANSGGLSLELARRGADVLAAEPCTNPAIAKQIGLTFHDPEPVLALAHHEGVSLQFSDSGLFDLTRLDDFDTVICFGLIYHFRYPQYLIDYLSWAGARTLYLSTQTMPGEDLAMRNRNEMAGREKLARLGGLRGYEPTHRLLRGMLGAAGFENVELLTDREYNFPQWPKGATNSAYYRAELVHRVDPDQMAKLFEPPLPRPGAPGMRRMDD